MSSKLYIRLKYAADDYFFYIIDTADTAIRPTPFFPLHNYRGRAFFFDKSRLGEKLRSITKNIIIEVNNASQKRRSLPPSDIRFILFNSKNRIIPIPQEKIQFCITTTALNLSQSHFEEMNAGDKPKDDFPYIGAQAAHKWINETGSKHSLYAVLDEYKKAGQAFMLAKELNMSASDAEVLTNL